MDACGSGTECTSDATGATVARREPDASECDGGLGRGGRRAAREGCVRERGCRGCDGERVGPRGSQHGREGEHGCGAADARAARARERDGRRPVRRGGRRAARTAAVECRAVRDDPHGAPPRRLAGPRTRTGARARTGAGAVAGAGPVAVRRGADGGGRGRRRHDGAAKAGRDGDFDDGAVVRRGDGPVRRDVPRGAARCARGRRGRAAGGRGRDALWQLRGRVQAQPALPAHARGRRARLGAAEHARQRL